jgi:hypothetical protein
MEPFPRRLCYGRDRPFAGSSSGELMTVLSAIGGAVLLSIGSNFIVPIGSAVGGVCDLAGIASLMVFLGLLDGE